MMHREKEDNRNDKKYDDISAAQTPFPFKNKGHFKNIHSFTSPVKKF
jgi:hypothetical protein